MSKKSFKTLIKRATTPVTKEQYKQQLANKDSEG